MSFKGRIGLLIAGVLGVIILITLLAAPINNETLQGSTYSRSPGGYGAWYSFMSERGVNIQRYKKPWPNFVEDQDITTPITLLRIYSTLREPFLYSQEQEWIKQGNTLIILGMRQQVTKAPFSSMIDSDVGKIKIETTRRSNNQEVILGDEYGAIVSETEIGEGKVIVSTTPYLAANAYQDIPGNYEFLAQLVTANGEVIWVDEYIHGYKDEEIIVEEIGEDVFSYLAKTPLIPLAIQGIIIILIAVWAHNHRWGEAEKLSTVKVNNSQAYIQALAGVLSKANSTQFLVEVIGKEEQRQLQKSLGLGDNLLDHHTLIKAWVQQKKRNHEQLTSLLRVSARKKKISETDLLAWLKGWEKIRGVR